MYTIFVDNKVLYSPLLFNEGCGVLSPKLTIELNKAGSLQFTIPPHNLLYNEVKKLKSMVTVLQNGIELFRGRVLYDDRDMYNQKQTYCEGELAFLLDSKQRPYTFENGTPAELFTKYITNHNARVEAAKRFTVGKVDVTTTSNSAITGTEDDDNKISVENKNYPSTIDEINNLISNYGGYVKIRSSGSKRYIDWTNKSGNKSTQTIEFGVNLLDITEHITAENIFTILIPLGASRTDDNGNDLGKLTITSVNNGKDYIENTTAINLFGRIEEKYEWSEVTDAKKLLSLGKKLLDKNIELSISLSLKAVDLSMLNVSYDRIQLGDYVRVISIPHNLDKEFQCTKIVYDMMNPDQNEYTFGISYTSLTEKIAK